MLVIAIAIHLEGTFPATVLMIQMTCLFRPPRTPITIILIFMLVILAPYKFTKFHYLIYELDIFKNNISESIEIHDLSRIINPKSFT